MSSLHPLMFSTLEDFHEDTGACLRLCGSSSKVARDGEDCRERIQQVPFMKVISKGDLALLFSFFFFLSVLGSHTCQKVLKVDQSQCVLSDSPFSRTKHYSQIASSEVPPLIL